MNTFKYFSKTLLHYFLTILGMAFLALFLLILGFALLFQESFQQSNSPSQLYQRMIKDDEIQLTPAIQEEMTQEKVWVLVLTEDGQVEQSYRLPQKLSQKTTYSRTDVARFSRWYLEDYPVFTYIVGKKLLVLGYPKDSYTKIAGVLELQAFKRLIYLGLGIVGILFLTYFLFFWRSRLKLKREMDPITNALEQLSKEEFPRLDEAGNLSEIKRAINQTSKLLEDTRELQSHWVRGVTHDLRSPLTLTLGYTDQLESLYGSTPQTQKISQSISKMENIIANLNLLYRLNSQEVKKEMKELDLTALLRHILADFLNQHPEAELAIDLPSQPLIIFGNPVLIERAVTNCLLNSLLHNVNPHLQVQLEAVDHQARLLLADDGQISSDKIKELEDKVSNYNTHGMGTLITKQILALHQGQISFQSNHPGLKVVWTIPLV